MSKFNVLVIGNNPETQLQAFQSFEGSQVESDKVQEIDRTDLIMKAYHDPEGCFYKQPDGRLVAVGKADGEEENGTEVNGRACDLMSPREFLDAVKIPEFALVQPGETPDLVENHKFCYFQMDENGGFRYIDRTIPDSKFNTFELGGRWNNFLRLKREYIDAVEEVDASRKVEIEPSAKALAKVETLVREEPPKGIGESIARMLSGQKEQEAQFVNGAPFGALDLDYMVTNRLDRAMAMYDDAQKVIDGRPWETPDHFRAKFDSEREAAVAFADQPVLIDLAKNGLARAINEGNRWDDIKLPREAFQEKYTMASIVPHAMVMDGAWHSLEGAHPNDPEKWMDEKAWSEEVAALLTQVSDDTLVHVYACDR